MPAAMESLITTDRLTMVPHGVADFDDMVAMWGDARVTPFLGGQPFNAEFHQAMMEVEDSSQPAGTVVQELVPGYLIAGRLLRPAMVAVSKGGPMRTPTPANDTPEN